jgi:hypothetical protein
MALGNRGRMSKPTSVKPWRLSVHGNHPVCPRCEWGVHDDWWHVLQDRKDGPPSGRLDCSGCGKVFFIAGVPGNVSSTAFGLNTTDREMRALGY